MGMFDGFKDLSGNRKLPTGETPADVVEVFNNEDTGTVSIKFRFRAFEGAELSQRHWLLKKDGNPNEVGAKILAKQLRNVGFVVKSGEDLQNALAGLKGKPVIVDVTNKKGSDYQDFYITGLGQHERGADSEEEAEEASEPDDSDLPF